MIGLLASTITLHPDRAATQQATAQIGGTVAPDASGAVVVGAQVEVRDLDTKISRSTKTNQNGN